MVTKNKKRRQCPALEPCPSRVDSVTAIDFYDRFPMAGNNAIKYDLLWFCNDWQITSEACCYWRRMFGHCSLLDHVLGTPSDKQKVLDFHSAWKCFIYSKEPQICTSFGIFITEERNTLLLPRVGDELKWEGYRSSLYGSRFNQGHAWWGEFEGFPGLQLLPSDFGDKRVSAKK